MKAKRRRFPIVVRRGSSAVKIYRDRKPTGTYYRLSYHIDGRRHRLHYNDLDKAIAEAEAKAAQLSRCDGAAATFSERDRHIYERALEEIKDFDVPPDAAAHEYKQARKLLDGVPLVDAAQFYPDTQAALLNSSRVRERASDALQNLMARTPASA